MNKIYWYCINFSRTRDCKAWC